MRIIHLPWVVLLLAGLVYLLVSSSAVEIVIGAVMALCGLAGWVATAKRTRGAPTNRDRSRP